MSKVTKRHKLLCFTVFSVSKINFQDTKVIKFLLPVIISLEIITSPLINATGRLIAVLRYISLIYWRQQKRYSFFEISVFEVITVTLFCQMLVKSTETRRRSRLLKGRCTPVLLVKTLRSMCKYTLCSIHFCHIQPAPG